MRTFIENHIADKDIDGYDTNIEEHQRLKLLGHDVALGPSQEPTDIIWENLGAEKKSKKWQDRLTVFAYCMLFIVTVGILGVLFDWKKKASQSLDPKIDYE